MANVCCCWRRCCRCCYCYHCDCWCCCFSHWRWHVVCVYPRVCICIGWIHSSRNCRIKDIQAHTQTHIYTHVSVAFMCVGVSWKFYCLLVILSICVSTKTFRMFKPVEIYKCDGTVAMVAPTTTTTTAASTMNNGAPALKSQQQQ